MNWNTLDIKPKDNSWILIQSSLKNVPKYEVCIYENGEWFIPSNDDVCEESDIIKWCYIENPSAEQSAEQCSYCGNENVTTESDGVWCYECCTWESKKV